MALKVYSLSNAIFWRILSRFFSSRFLGRSRRFGNVFLPQFHGFQFISNQSRIELSNAGLGLISLPFSPIGGYFEVNPSSIILQVIES